MIACWEIHFNRCITKKITPPHIQWCCSPCLPAQPEIHGTDDTWLTKHIRKALHAFPSILQLRCRLGTRRSPLPTESLWSLHRRQWALPGSSAAGTRKQDVSCHEQNNSHRTLLSPSVSAHSYQTQDLKRDITQC